MYHYAMLSGADVAPDVYCQVDMDKLRPKLLALRAAHETAIKLLEDSCLPFTGHEGFCLQYNVPFKVTSINPFDKIGFLEYLFTEAEPPKVDWLDVEFSCVVICGSGFYFECQLNSFESDDPDDPLVPSEHYKYPSNFVPWLALDKEAP